MSNLLISLIYFVTLQTGGPLPSKLPQPHTGNVFAKIPKCSTSLGAWVKYRVLSKTKSMTYELKLAFVGRPVDGKGMWLEMEMKYSNYKLKFKILLTGTPDRPGTVKKMIMQMGELAPVSLPIDRSKDVIPLISAGPSVPIRLVKEERVKVPAGTFRARRYEGKDADGNRTVFWFSNKVPIWRMLKYDSSRIEMTLISYGTNARSTLPDDAPPMRF